ncbi:MAG TPA: type II secretion system F family protein [Acidimicrobiia bacterium]|nr:type II secretion system F family protein [Acidimicrobiia bacterium]
MDFSVLVGAIAVGASIPLLVFGLGERDDAATTIRRNLRGEEIVVDERVRSLRAPALDRVIRPAIRSLADRGRRLTPVGWIEALERRVRLAGSPAAWPLERVLAAKVIAGVLGVVIALYLLAGAVNAFTVAMAVMAGLGGYFVPDLILVGRAKERQQAISLALPDTLDQMTVTVEAGLGFDAALQRVARNTTGPLAVELKRTLNEVKLGAKRQQALENLTLRTDVEELRHFVYAIRQAEEFGLPVANVLRIQAAELRVKRRQRAEERALKIPVKLVFPLVLCIFPSLFIVLLAPAFIRIGGAF